MESVSQSVGVCQRRRLDEEPSTSFSKQQALYQQSLRSRFIGPAGREPLEPTWASRRRSRHAIPVFYTRCTRIFIQMTSHPRRGSGPVRQHSLQQPPRRHHQVRRQRSAEEDRALQIRTTDPIRARRDAERSNVERPKVRIAWGDDSRLADDDSDNRVEVVACQIATTGKTRPTNSGKQPRIIGRNSANDKTCSTLLYSRQELAERLRLAWKQREANKSNIDVFLAHGTTEERSDSRLSSSSSAERSPARSSPTPQRNTENNNVQCKNERIEKITDNNEAKSVQNSMVSTASTSRLENSITASEGAKSKRASFKSCTNTAFLELDNDSSGGSPTPEPPMTKKEQIIQPNNTATFNNELKTRRTNSAPPQRRANSVGATSRTQVSIVIEAPSICKNDQDSGVSQTCVEANSLISKTPVLTGRPIKSAPAKRRARSGKKRANSVASKDLEAGRAKIENKNSEVVTMVSLVSDADSDSEVEENSPRDDKLISQLRSNLPTTPIIKNTVATCGSSNSIVRRPIKSVSFQQDSFDVEEIDKRSARIRPQSVQVGRVNGSALPTPEEARSWRTEITTLTISTTNSLTTRQRYESQELTEISLTDREKRCLVVPIGDPRSDKKRKLLRTRSTPPQRVNGVEKQPTMHQNDTREASARPRIPAAIENVQPVQQSTSILLQASVTKLVDETDGNFKAGNEPEADAESVEPAFQTTKEKECWHLYRRMCDKGVCVSFDTVLRGMLTPTEYRLRRKEVT